MIRVAGSYPITDPRIGALLGQCSDLSQRLDRDRRRRLRSEDLEGLCARADRLARAARELADRADLELEQITWATA